MEGGGETESEIDDIEREIYYGEKRERERERGQEEVRVREREREGVIVKFAPFSLVLSFPSFIPLLFLSPLSLSHLSLFFLLSSFFLPHCTPSLSLSPHTLTLCFSLSLSLSPLSLSIYLSLSSSPRVSSPV